MARLGTILFKNLNFLTNGNLFLNRIQTDFSPLVSTIKTDVVHKLKELDIPEKPKKPGNPYIVFVNEIRPKLVKENPNLEATKIISKCGQLWKTLDDDAKAKYIQTYKHLQDKYDSDILKFNSTLSEGQREALALFADSKKKERQARKRRKELIELEKPKKPLNAYTLYLTEVSKMRNITMKTLMREANEQWKNLPDAEKQVYEKRAHKHKEEYEKALNLWEERMKSIGREDLIRKKSEPVLLKKLTREQLEKPKIPPNCYALFVKEMTKPTNVTFGEYVRDIGKKWKNLTDKEKHSYELKAQKLKEKYKKQLEIWEEKMELRGKLKSLTKSGLANVEPKKRARILKFFG